MYILIILAVTATNAPALTNIPGWNSQNECEQAGKEAVKDLNRSFTSLSYACITRK